jgi:hypothetical protein
MASPVIPFSTQEQADEVPADMVSLQADNEISADVATQPDSIIPLPGQEHLRQAEEEMRQAEEERARQEKEQADKLEEERVRKEKETALAATELDTEVHQTPLPAEATRSLNPHLLRTNTMVAAKPAKPDASRRISLLVLAGLLIVALAFGWFTIHHPSPISPTSSTGSITEFRVPTAKSSPLGIAAGPDGNLWFTEAYGNQIGRITPSK